MASKKEICILRAWRETCLKKFSISLRRDTEHAQAACTSCAVMREYPYHPVRGSLPREKAPAGTGGT